MTQEKSNGSFLLFSVCEPPRKKVVQNLNKGSPSNLSSLGPPFDQLVLLGQMMICKNHEIFLI